MAPTSACATGRPKPRTRSKIRRKERQAIDTHAFSFSGSVSRDPLDYEVGGMRGQLYNVYFV